MIKNKQADSDKEEVRTTYRKASNEGINLIVGELRALLTCPHEYHLFKRLISRTMVMLKNESSLRKLWKQANKHYQNIVQERKILLDNLHKSREDLKLDEELPSLFIKVRVWNRMEGKRLLEKECTKKYWELAVPLELSDRWISEAKEWANSKKVQDKVIPFSEYGGKVHALLGCISRWECEEPTWYPIGTHPIVSLARLLGICERVEFLLLKDTKYCSPLTRYRESSSSEHIYEVINGLCRELEWIVANLVAELPILKSWGNFSVEAIGWRRMAEKLALNVRIRDKTMPIAELARRIFPEVREWDIEISTLEKYLATIDTRSPEERKQAQRRRKLKNISKT